MHRLKTKLQFHSISDTDLVPRWKYDPTLPEFDSRCLLTHRPDAHWLAVRDDVVAARCSLWWSTTPQFDCGKLGLIGHYACIDDNESDRFLDFVTRQLASCGCDVAIGPMDQNTWRDYRFITDHGNRPGFFLEPTGSDQHREQFRNHGFHEVASYFSAWVDDLTATNRRLGAVRDRMTRQGIHLRGLTDDSSDADLRQIYTVVRSAFSSNPFYVPISESDFMDIYRPLRHSVPTDFILLAQDGDRVVGFCFAVPDLLQAKRGLTIDTVVVKTFGVLPEFAYAGVGQVLLEEVHHRAAQSGFRHGIHAMIREVDHMKRLIAQYAKPFRRYALFGKELSR